MKIRDFGVEMYMNAHEDHCEINLAETCADSMTVEELLAITGDAESALRDICSMRLTYGAIVGSERLRRAVSSLYTSVSPDRITITHGAIGANALVIESLVEPSDRVLSVCPTYQQHYSIPEAYGADVKILPLTVENKFLPSLADIRAQMNDRVKLICLNNPNNPSGSLMDEAYLREIVDIAREHGAYILCDEVYRGLNHDGDPFTASMADLYEKGISTGSMSKAYALAGLRIGWIAGPEEVIRAVSVHRDYNTISCGMIDDYLAAIALEHKDAILSRNLAIIRDCAKILDDWVAGEENFDYVRPTSGTTAFIKINLDIPSEEFALGLLREKGVLVVPGSAMHTEGFFRMGYGYSKDYDVFREGLKRISDYAKTLR